MQQIQLTWTCYATFCSPTCTCLSAGPEAVEAQCQRLEVRNRDGGRLLFTADEEEVVMTTEKFTVTGKKKKKNPYFQLVMCWYIRDIE